MRERVPIPKCHLVVLLLLLRVMVHRRAMMMMRRHCMLLLLLLLVMLLHLNMMRQNRRRHSRRRWNASIPKLNRTTTTTNQSGFVVLHIHPIPSSSCISMRHVCLLHPNTKLIPILLFFLPTNDKHLHLPTNHHPKAFPPPRLLDPRYTRAVPPLVDLPPQRVCFEFQDPQLPSGE